MNMNTMEAAKLYGITRRECSSCRLVLTGAWKAKPPGHPSLVLMPGSLLAAVALCLSPAVHADVNFTLADLHEEPRQLPFRVHVYTKQA
jgi:hypothetical protein